jgi:hypothetical protein
MLRALIVAFGLTVAGMSPVSAQVPQDAPRAGRTGPPGSGGLSSAELITMLDTYAIVQAQETLQLADGQYAQFVLRLKKLQEARRRNQRARNQILQDLRRLSTATTADEAAIRERLKALTDHDDRASAELRQAYGSVDELLDVRQRARFRVFEENIERRKLDLLVRARERAARLPRRSGGS